MGAVMEETNTAAAVDGTTDPISRVAGRAEEDDGGCGCGCCGGAAQGRAASCACCSGLASAAACGCGCCGGMTAQGAAVTVTSAQLRAMADLIESRAACCTPSIQPRTIACC